jgi:hypothetical protein
MISTRVLGILREHYGRGRMKAKTCRLDDIVVVMRGSAARRSAKFASEWREAVL